jgi:DNA-binding PucR family transcriptional regulator
LSKLSEILQLPVLEPARLLGDPGAIENREIGSVSVIEVPVGKFIRPGEFVLSTGMNVGHDHRTLARFVKEVAESGAAALAIAIGPYTPRIPGGVISAARRAGLALIELPWELRFSDISESILRRLIEEQAAIRTRDDFVWALATQSLSAESALAQARRLGYDLRRPSIGLQAKLSAPNAARLAENFCAQAAAQKGLQWLGAAVGEGVTGFIQAPRNKTAVLAILKTIQTRARGKLTISWGVGRVTREYEDFRKSHDDARIACEIGAQARGEGSITDVSDVLADRVLLNVRRDADVVMLLERYIQPLQNAKRMPLLRTLEVFFENDSNASRTARRLSLSRQSLLYRIARIQEILSINLRDPNHRFALALALRLSRFRASAPSVRLPPAT